MSWPPGRARLGTKPLPTGSVTSTNTIGSARLTGSSRPAITGVVGAKIRSGGKPDEQSVSRCRIALKTGPTRSKELSGNHGVSFCANVCAADLPPAS